MWCIMADDYGQRIILSKHIERRIYVWTIYRFGYQFKLKRWCILYIAVKVWYKNFEQDNTFVHNNDTVGIWELIISHVRQI